MSIETMMQRSSLIVGGGGGGGRTTCGCEVAVFGVAVLLSASSVRILIRADGSFLDFAVCFLTPAPDGDGVPAVDLDLAVLAGTNFNIPAFAPVTEPSFGLIAVKGFNFFNFGAIATFPDNSEPELPEATDPTPSLSTSSALSLNWANSAGSSVGIRYLSAYSCLTIHGAPILEEYFVIQSLMKVLAKVLVNWFLSRNISSSPHIIF
ncbi:hypothetical protein WICPIJ_006935 [Wickerhamomyces pijperi]|uniref:Uncharacterized protein n=1 Tax=Wickerhamomyces pijperi TaxID=599730 RepID=A0A9P8TKH3_WICPI|nr:hypothetical protein WICPIJ_006935 [Wickerhamomyces pijperi]